MASEPLFPTRRRPLLLAFVLILLVTPVVVICGAVAWLLLFSTPRPALRILNDTGTMVHVVSCSQGKAPTPFDVQPNRDLIFKDWWSTGDDTGFGCYIRGAAISGRNGGACLEMPTGGTRQFEFRVSEADPTLTEKQCMDRSSPSL